jgi:hypothetical protein
MTVTTVGDNAFIPGAFAETYVPDQLVAGSFKLVTQPITVSGSAVLPRGTVLGQLSSYSVIPAAGTNTGTGTIGTFTTGVGAQIGNYTLTATGATTFSVTNPQGTAQANATVGTAYNVSGIGFTITAGGTAFVAGDKFTLNVVDSIGNFIECVKTASDGSQTPCAILVDYADPTSGPVRAGAYIAGEFNVNAVTYDASWTPELLTTALRQYSIFLKTSVTATDPGTTVTNFA